ITDEVTDIVITRRDNGAAITVVITVVMIFGKCGAKIRWSSEQGPAWYGCADTAIPYLKCQQHQAIFRMDCAIIKVSKISYSKLLQAFCRSGIPVVCLVKSIRELVARWNERLLGAFL